MLSISIVGKPNVGKSALFNRLIGTQAAIVHSASGVTRDRKAGISQWCGHKFVLVDTGGWEGLKTAGMSKKILMQAQAAIQETDIVFHLLDRDQGWTALDDEITHYLRHQFLSQPSANNQTAPKKSVYVLANKFEHSNHMAELGQFYQAGAEHVFPISALQNEGLDECLDQIKQDYNLLDSSTQPKAETTHLKIALVGRPNVGKSTMANAFLGQEKHIVDEQAGTTRDSIKSDFRFNNQNFSLIDTAGLRKKSQIRSNNDDLEYYSVGSTLHSIEQAQVVLVIADCQQGFVEQDFRIMHFALKRGKSLVLVFNKWDLVPKDSNSLASIEKEFYLQHPQYNFCPLVFTSAAKHARLDKLLLKAQEVFAQQTRRIPTPVFNKILDRIKTRGALPKNFKIYYGTQTTVGPPTFVFKTNSSKPLKSAVQFLENQLRHHFEFEGTPLRVRCLKN